MVLPTGGLTSFRRPGDAGRVAAGRPQPLATPDLTGDGQADLVTFDDAGSLEIRPGPAADGYRTVARQARGFRGHDLVTSAGDLDGDGRADLVARSAGPAWSASCGRQRAASAGSPQDTGLRGYEQLVGAGDVTGDGDADLWGRDDAGRLWLLPGEGDGSFAAPDPGHRRRRPTSTRSSAASTTPATRSRTCWSGGRAGRCSCCPPGATAPSAARSGRSATPLGSRMVSGAGQVTGNAAPDLVAVGPGGALVVLPNRGTFDLGQPINTGQSFARADLLLNAGDFDGDGRRRRDRRAAGSARCGSTAARGTGPAGGPAVGSAASGRSGP